MFHRAKNEGIKPQVKRDNREPQNQGQGGMNQTAVKRFSQSQDENLKTQNSANQNATMQADQIEQHNITINHSTKKEAILMNNPEPQNKNNAQSNTQNSQPQARVDIPGNNFQRPNAPQSNTQASRPAYPGTPSYPGASSNNAAAPSSSNYNTQANDASEGRKLNIGQGITLSGEIEACDHLVVEGTVEAALKGANVLEIAESGAFYGTVEIEDATIAGRFEGDITVKGSLKIESTGVIIGSVSYKELSMEAGATLDGSVSPIGSQNAAQKSGGKKATSKAKKVSQNSGAELPFADRSAEAAE